MRWLLRALRRPVGVRSASAIVLLLLLTQFVVVPSFYNFHRPIDDLGNMFGPPTEAVLSTGSLWVCSDDPPVPCSFASRMPLMPYFYAAVALVTGDSVYRLALVKTALLDVLLFYFLTRFFSTFGTDLFSLASVAVALAGPQFMLHSFSPDYEEGFLVQLLAVMLILQMIYSMKRWRELPRRAGIPAFVAVGAATFLLKSSMLLVAVWNIAFALGHVGERTRTRVAVAALLCLPPLLWGAVVGRETGRFELGTSIDGWNLLLGNNPVTLTFYPRYAVQASIGDGTVEIDGQTVKQLSLVDIDPRLAPNGSLNEWQEDALRRDAAIHWAVRHSAEELRLLGRKLWVFFLDIRNSPITPGVGKPPALALAAGAAWMAAMRLILWSAIISAVIALWRGGTLKPPAGAFLMTLVCYAAPYIIGYAAERHVVPILLPAALFMALAWRTSANSAL